MEQTGEKIREALGPVSEIAINQIRSITNLIQEPLKEELPRLVEKFATYRKGFGEFNNKYIKMPFEHIFGAEFVFDKKGKVKNISGFHHDFMGMLENSGLIEFRNKVVGKFGVYSADIFMNGKKIATKTFFPKEWTREKVIEKIYETYDSYLAKVLTGEMIHRIETDGKFIIETITSEGIKVRMYMTRNSKITSVYPILD